MKHPPTRAGETPVPRLALLPFVLALASFAVLPSCVTTGTTGGSSAASVGSGSVEGQLSSSQLNHPQVKARNAIIATETPGNYYIGRRWWTDGTRFWGYLREPGKPWSTAKLVIMNESAMKQPDRIPEEGSLQVHGFDHNYEYRIWGSFTGKKIYDPNSNFVIPEFRLSKYELISSSPGFLFYPGEKYNPRHLPEVHPPFPGS
jgi:hypothetical protein